MISIGTCNGSLRDILVPEMVHDGAAGTVL